MITALSSAYVKTARAKGVRERVVIFVHALQKRHAARDHRGRVIRQPASSMAPSWLKPSSAFPASAS